MALAWNAVASLLIAWFTEPWYGIALFACGVLMEAGDRFVGDRRMPDKQEKKDA